MNKCGVVFIVLVSTVVAYWNEDYQNQRYPQYYHYGNSGYHNYHPQHNNYKRKPCGGYGQYPCYSSESGSGDGSPEVEWNSDNSRPNVNWKHQNTRSPQAWHDTFMAYDFIACLRRCDTTPDYNPVCGTDGVTYINLSAVQCVRLCGRNINIAAPYPCPTNEGASPKPNEAVTPPTQQNTQACIVNCPTTSEYNPVCGTNGVTYSNPSRLECAQMCGIDVKFLQKYRCPVGQLPLNATSPSTPTAAPLPTPPLTPPVTPSPTPIATPPPIVTPPIIATPTPTPSVPPTVPEVAFTIPKDILEGIFTTTEEGPDIDIRDID